MFASPRRGRPGCSGAGASSNTSPPMESNTSNTVSSRLRLHSFLVGVLAFLPLPLVPLVTGGPSFTSSSSSSTESSTWYVATSSKLTPSSETLGLALLGVTMSPIWLSSAPSSLPLDFSSGASWGLVSFLVGPAWFSNGSSGFLPDSSATGAVGCSFFTRTFLAVCLVGLPLLPLVGSWTPSITPPSTESVTWYSTSSSFGWG